MGAGADALQPDTAVGCMTACFAAGQIAGPLGVRWMGATLFCRGGIFQACLTERSAHG